MTRGFTKPFILQHALRVPGPLDHRLQAAAPLLQIHRQSSPQYLRASAATQQMICLVFQSPQHEPCSSFTPPALGDVDIRMFPSA